MRALAVRAVPVLAGLVMTLAAAAAWAAPAKKPAPAPITPATLAEIRAALRAPGARAVLLNVWATWCDPCREEMPDLVRFYRENKARGLRLLLVSTDSRDELREAQAFLAAQGVDFPSFLKVDGDQAFIDGLDKRWSGVLPASFLFDGAGKTVHFWSGKVTRAALQGKLDEFLGETKPSWVSPENTETKPRRNP